MKLERVLVRFRQMFLIIGSGLSLVGALLLGLSLLIDEYSPDLPPVNAEAMDCKVPSSCVTVKYAVDDSPQPAELTSPLPVSQPSSPPNDKRALFSANHSDPEDAKISTTSDTLTVPETDRRQPSTPPAKSRTPIVSASTPLELSAELVTEDSYTSTVQVHPRTTSPNQESAVASTFSAPCPASSTASFELVPIDGPPASHPDKLHGDFNLALRGYEIVPEPPELIAFEGETAPDPPQLSGLFQPNRTPLMKAVYRVNQWIWDVGQCGGQIHGCPGPLIAGWDVTLVGLTTSLGEAISIPERTTQIFGGGFKALVLYADERQITLGFTRRDTVAAGYAVHLLGVCVDPNLVALYRAQNDANGWRTSGQLPALRNDQILGTALGHEIKVSIRDSGSFMDPRSGKDWWQGH